MKRFSCLILFSAWSVCIQCQELLPVLVNGKWGYVDTSGTIAITPQYDYASFFRSNPFAIVEASNKYSIINSSGKAYCAFKYDSIYHLFNSIFAFLSDQKWNIGSIDGISILKHQFDSIKPFNDFVKLYKGNKCGLLQINRNYIGTNYDDIGFFSPQSFLVTINNKYGLINLHGEYLIQPRYDRIYTMNDSLVRTSLNNKWGIINQYKNYSIEPRWNRFEFYNKGYIKGYLDSAVQLVAYPSGAIISEAYDDYQEGSKDYIIVKRKSKLGLMNSKGEEMIRPQYDEIVYFKENYFIVEKNEKKGLVNGSGDTIISLEYDEISEFINKDKLQLFKVKKRGKLGLVNYDDKVILPMEFDFIACREDGYFIVREKKFIGLYTSAGKRVLPSLFHAIGKFEKNVLMAKVDNCYALGNRDSLISGPIHDRIMIASKVAKLYRDDTLEVINLTDNGTVFDQYQYVGMESYKVAKREMLTLPEPGTYDEPENEKGLEFKYSLKHGKWGIFDKLSKQFIGHTKYDRIHYTLKANFIITEIFTEPVEFSIGGVYLNCNSLYGLVNIKTGIEVLGNEYIYIQLAARDNRKKVDYAIHKNGIWSYIDIGRKYDANYIDDSFQYGVDRFHSKGKVEVGEYMKENSVKDFQELLADITKRGSVWLKDSMDFTLHSSAGKFVNCLGGSWSYTTLPESTSQTAYWGDDLYLYAEPFNGRQSIVSKGHEKFGIQTSKKEEVLKFSYSSIQHLPFSKDYGPYLLSEVIPTYGFIDEQGKLKIECQYSNAGQFSEGLVQVQVKNNWGFIDQSGKEVINCVYKKVTDFHNGISIACGEKNYGVLTATGDTALPFSYLFLQLINDTLFLYKDKKGYGLMSFKGDTIISSRYKGPFEFNKVGLAVIETKKGHGIINRQGQVLVKNKYDKIGKIGENGLVCVKVNKTFRLINARTGKKVNKEIYSKMLEESCGLIAFKGEKNYGYMNSEGDVVIQESFKKAEGFVNDIAIVKENKYWALIDINGKILTTSEWESITTFGNHFLAKDRTGIYSLLDNSGKILFKEDGFKLTAPFSEGNAIAQRTDDNYFYINENGQMALNQFFEEAKPFVNGKAFVKSGGKWGVINNTGEFILKPRYYQIDNFREGVAKVMISPLFGTGAYNGTILLEPQFEELEPISDNVFLVKKNNKLGYIRANGSTIWPLQK